MSGAELAARKAAPADYDRFVRLFQELATGDPIPSPDRWEAIFAPGILFFEDGGEVVAYAYSEILQGTGYVRHVVVDPAHRGRRYGRAVMDELAALFRAAGCDRWELNVKPDNAPAIALYRSVGMRPAYTSTALRLEWTVVDALPQPAGDPRGAPVDPADDDRVESAFHLPSGTLAVGRARPGRVVLALTDPAAPGALHGVASFDVHFPGAFPFRVAAPAYARPLFEAMKLHALPEHTHVGIVAEDDAALTKLLLDHGAVAHLEIVHYSGRL